MKTSPQLIKKPIFYSRYFLPSTFPHVLHHFTPATLSEISDLLSQSPNSHCNLDPIPTTVLKKIANEIAPIILSIVNLSILTAFHSYWYFPLLFKIISNQPVTKTRKSSIEAGIRRNAICYNT